MCRLDLGTTDTDNLKHTQQEVTWMTEGLESKLNTKQLTEQEVFGLIEVKV